MKNIKPILSPVTEYIQKQNELLQEITKSVIVQKSVIKSTTDSIHQNALSSIKAGLDAVKIYNYSEYITKLEESLKATTSPINEMIIPITKNLEVLTSLKATYQSAFDALQAFQSNYIIDAEKIVDIYEDINFQTFLDIDAESEDNECIRNITVDEFKEVIDSIDFDSNPTESIKTYNNCTFIVMNSNNPKIKNVFFSKFINIIKQSIEKATITTIYIVIMVFLYKLIEKYEIFEELLKFISEHSEIF